MDIVQQLEHLDLKSATPDDVRKIIGQAPLLCVPYIIKPGNYLLRARKGGGYTKRSQLTYCPVRKCTSMQRATLANHTMFYGVISDDQSHQENARAISVTECSSLCREGIKSVGREKFTVSHWEVVKPLRIVSLVTDYAFPNVTNNNLLNLLRNAYLAIHSGANSTDGEKDLAEFISKEFSKPVKESYEYLISATIATDILTDTDFDGIVFPSVMLGGQAGLNIALTTKAVNMKLRYVRAIEHSLFKNGDKTLVRIEYATERDGSKRNLCQYPNFVVEKELHIKSINDLPLR